MQHFYRKRNRCTFVRCAINRVPHKNASAVYDLHVYLKRWNNGKFIHKSRIGFVCLEFNAAFNSFGHIAAVSAPTHVFLAFPHQYLHNILSKPPSHEKTNIVDNALSIDPDQPKANPVRHYSLPVDFLFQESLLYTSILLRRNVSTRISLCRLRRLIWVDTLRRVHTAGFLVERLQCVYSLK